MLVAVSGGADSVALLDVLQRAGYRCVAAHCNFHLRGEESNRDEAFVRELCAQMNVPLEVKDFDTNSYARAHHVGIEVAARNCGTRGSKKWHASMVVRLWRWHTIRMTKRRQFC